MMLSSELYIPFIYLYIITAFVITMLFFLLLYVSFSRKYRLNWYEKNLLESVISSKINSETSSMQSFYPSVEEASINLCDAAVTNTPLIRTENVHVTLEELVLSNAEPLDNKIEFSNLSTGLIHLVLLYDVTAGILTVRIVQANHLVATKSNGTANPYAKIRLLPHHNNVWQTRVHTKTLNPVFDEDFVFEVSPQKIQECSIEVVIYDFNAYFQHQNIGNLQLSLKTLDLYQQTSIWMELKPYPDQNKKAEFGELLISLSYLPLKEQLTIIIIKARNLKIIDEIHIPSDLFIKVSLMLNGKKIKKQRTNCHQNTISPLFNETLSFNINQEIMKNCCIEFKVLCDNLLTNNESLGCCIIGKDINNYSNECQIFEKLIHDKVVPPQWLSLIDQ